MKTIKKNFTFLLMALALSPSVTATPSLNPSPTRPAIIEEIREAVKEKVKEKLAEVKKGIPLAWTGEIEEIGDSELNLSTRLGSKSVFINEDTKLIGLGSKNIIFTDLKVGNLVIAMGYLNENEVLEAKRVVLTTKSKSVVREVAFGLVTDISTEEKLLTVKNDKLGRIYSVVVYNKTMITKKQDSKIEKTNFSAIQVNDRIVAIGTPTENEEKLITAKIIHVIPAATPP